MEIIKKWKTVIISFFFLAIIAVLCLVGVLTIDKYKAIIQTDQDTITSLSNTIDSDIGPTVDCYVVNTSVRVGDEITEDKLTVVTIPEKIAYCNREKQVTTINENNQPVLTTEKEQALAVVTSVNDVVGKRFRVDMSEGTILFSDFVMENKIDNSSRYYELTLDEFPTDINIGDYVDIRIQFTYGQDFISLPHRRIEGMNLETGVFKFVFSESDIYTYNSMLLDKAMYPGVTLYMLRYIDNTAQTAAEAYYPINDNISEMLEINPNILTAAKEEMSLERKKLNGILGGDIGTFDQEQLDKVQEYLEDFRGDSEDSKQQALKDRIKAEKEAAEAAARANQ